MAWIEPYTHTFTVNVMDLDCTGRMKMPAVLDYMQRIAEEHADAIGVGRRDTLRHGYVWLVGRTHVCMDRLPQLDQTFSLTTWPGDHSRMTCPRYFEFQDASGASIGRAAMIWTLVHVQTRRITAPDKTPLPIREWESAPAPMDLPERLLALQTVDRSVVRRPVYSDLDVNGHVNNARYVDWICDLFAPDDYQRRTMMDLQINYGREIRQDAAVRLELHEEGNTFHVQGMDEQGGLPLFQAMGSWTPVQK